MMGLKRSYDYAAADKLENYVRRRYPRQLSNGAMQMYFALPYLEKRSLGLCQPITANYKELGAASFKDTSGLKKPLKELDGILCEVLLGSPIKEEKKATQIRRFTLRELTDGVPKRRLIDYTPVEAQQLAKELRGKSFTYGDNTKCRPFWSVSRTGKIVSGQPHVQGDAPFARIQNLCVGLGKDEVLIHLDIKQADPTIIRQIIEMPPNGDPYTILVGTEDITRAEAKKRINSLAYSSSPSMKIIRHWSQEAQEIFGSYAAALDDYKEQLWIAGKPRGKRRRFVQTLGGTRIDADRGQRAHRGQTMCWHIQGTVAEIVNASSRRIIDLSAERGWRYCFPVHDAIYVIGHTEHAVELRVILECEARRLDLELDVEVEIYDHTATAV